MPSQEVICVAPTGFGPVPLLPPPNAHYSPDTLRLLLSLPYVYSLTFLLLPPLSFPLLYHAFPSSLHPPLPSLWVRRLHPDLPLPPSFQSLLLPPCRSYSTHLSLPRPLLPLPSPLFLFSPPSRVLFT